MHAYYRQTKIEYRYFKMGPKRRKFDRTKSRSFKYWDLSRCLKDGNCPLDNDTKNNLRFLIGLRNEIVHHRALTIDQWFAGRYLACCLNYETYICKLFGLRYSLGNTPAFTLQFRDLKAIQTTDEAVSPLPSSVAKYVNEFDSQLSEEEFTSPQFRQRYLFTPLITTKKSQADTIVRFVRYTSQQGADMNRRYREIMIKETEKNKYLPTQVIELIQEEGYTGFGIQHHTKLWKDLDTRRPETGYGTFVSNQWYWYESWVNRVRLHCENNRHQFRPPTGSQ